MAHPVSGFLPCTPATFQQLNQLVAEPLNNEMRRQFRITQPPTPAELRHRDAMQRRANFLASCEGHIRGEMTDVEFLWQCRNAGAGLDSLPVVTPQGETDVNTGYTPLKEEGA